MHETWGTLVAVREMAEEYKAFAVYLRDISQGMVQAWEEVFSDPRYEKRIEASQSSAVIVMMYNYTSLHSSMYELLLGRGCDFCHFLTF